MKKTSILFVIGLVIAFMSNTNAQSSYCTPTYNGSGSDSKWFCHILNVKFGSINRSTTAPYSWNFPATIYDNLTSISTDVVPGQTYPLSIYVGNGANTQYVTAWIDFNANYVFESTERVFITIDYANQGDHIVRGYVKIPANAVIGKTRMRVGTNIILAANQAYPDPCTNSETANLASVGDIASQHFQDYTVNILNPKIQYYVSSNTVQLLTDEEVTHSSTNNPILRIEVSTNPDGIQSPIQVDTFYFNLLGTTNPAEITKAKLFYTGVNPEFADTTQVGKTISKPGTYFDINAAQTLEAGTNYFWLTYDISADALIGNLLDARCNGVHIDIRRVPQTIDPSGNRQIGYCVSAGTKTFIYVRNVELRDIDVTSYAYGYSDYTSYSTTLYKGYNHTLSVETGNGVNSNAVQAWIDFDQDGFFDNSLEKVLDDSIYITSAPPYLYGPVLDSFQIPINAPVGKTRMRVIAHYNPNDGSRSRALPCENPVEIGEVEDYTIIVADSGQALADFSSNVACLGDSTEFTDASTVFGSTYKLIAWQWDFGDGNTSSLQHPKHQYSKGGVYNVKLTVISNAPNAIISSITKAVNVNNPEADFSITSNLYKTPITFLDETTGGELLAYPNGNYWEFGDPSSGYNNYSQLKSPTHTFDKVGKYTIRMIVTSKGGCMDTTDKTIIIDSVITPISNFSAATFNPYFDQKVELLDISVYDPTYWRWEIIPQLFKFHDSTDKFSQNPVISFDAAGVYAVRLYTSNTAGGDSVTKVFNVKNYSKPMADFTAEPTKVKAGQTVTFLDKSENDPTTWAWAFGDRDSAFIQHPTKSYSKAGYFSVSLTASNPGGSSTEIKTNFIQVTDEYTMCDNEASMSNLFSGKILDSGGRNGEYNNGSDCSFLIEPPCSGPITLKFTAFDFEVGDYLFIYDGTTEDPDKLLTPAQGLSGVSLPASVTARSGAMLIVEKTNDQDQGDGFIAEWSAVANIVPNATIKCDSIGYVNAPVKFTNGTTSGAGNSYYWDYQNDGAIDDIFTSLDVIIDGRFTYTSKGYYNVKLFAENCKGSDSTLIKIHIVDPVSPPVADFEVLGNDTLVGEGEKVYFEDLSTMGPSSWKWEITPPDYFSVGYYTDGTTDSSQNPIVQFYGLGGYHVALTSANSMGSSQKVEKKKYILVIPYVTMGTWPFTREEEAGKIFDSGGDENNYDNDESYTLLLDPCAKDIFLSFSTFDLAQGDYLRVYDGDSENGTPLHTGSGFTGSDIPGTLIAESGKMFLVMESNSSSTGAGFEATWTITEIDPPVVDIVGPDTAFTGGSVTLFENAATGEEIEKYYWDYDFDNIYDDSTFNGQFAYTKTGYTFVRLTAVNCAASSVMAKLVYVEKPTQKPVARFEADVQIADTSDVITLSDLSLYGPNEWIWDFGTPKVQIVNSSDSVFPRVMINYDTTGLFDVTLIAKNSFGSDTLIKKDYLKIFSYCIPEVQNLLQDFGISYIKLNDLENISEAGTVSYSNFTQSYGATLEIGGTYDFTLRSTQAAYPLERKIWIDFNQDGIFEDSSIVSGELVALGKNQTTTEWNGTLSVPKDANLGQTRLRIGVDYGGYQNTPCGPNFFGEYEDYRVWITEDKTPPKITLIGDHIAFTEVHTTYIDSGAVAYDAVDGDLSSKVISTSSVDTSKTGKYWVKYNVSDNSDNAADEVIRTVYVTPDVTAPVVTIVGDNPMSIAVFNSFDAIDPGATAWDATDGDISNEILITHNIDTAVIDTYEVIYSVYDNNSNFGRNERIVYVVDTVAPVITLKGDKHVMIAVGTSYTDSGAVVTDNYYDSVELKVVSNVNIYVDGWYSVYYNATDGSGNKAQQVERVVRVGNPLSISEDLLKSMVKLYPNPSQGKVKLDIGGLMVNDLRIEVTNVLGQTVERMDIAPLSQSSFNIDLKDLSEGLYFFRIYLDHNLVVKPLTLTK